jgi:hypothetical protein
MELLKILPCTYISVAFAWSLYQGIRGAVEHHFANSKKGKHFYNWFILYIHDFSFRFVCTMAGFLCLYISYHLLTTLPNLADISSGSSAIIVFSFIVGVIGVGGQLHNVILFGKFPGAGG